jgi:hypothetical protein
MLHSEKLDLIVEKALPERIKEAIIQLREIDNTLSIHKWYNHAIAVAIRLPLSLPSRGPVNEVDIRPIEPVLIVFNLNKYPYKAPGAYSDRVDFPINSFAHLNPMPPNSPASFCLHRGNLDDWFAEHTILDFVARVQHWLVDAACDQLNRADDDFEPIRAVDTYGVNMFNEKDLTDHIIACSTKHVVSKGSGIITYELTKQLNNSKTDNNEYLLKNLSSLFQLSQHTAVLDLVRNYNVKAANNNLIKATAGLIVWAAKTELMSKYFPDIPDRLSEFLNWGDNIGLPLSESFKKFLKNKLNFFLGVPITVVLPRPRKLIGQNTNFEIINFITYPKVKNESDNITWNADSKVYRMMNLNPLTPDLAKEISDFKSDRNIDRTLFIGCGALGSKIALHLAKSGNTKMTFVDNDVLLPHNLARHGLTDGLYKCKAEALKEDIEKIFISQSLDLEAKCTSIIELLQPQNSFSLKEHKYIVDATASNSVANFLSETPLPASTKYTRVEIADQGQLSFLRIEGPNRNPRIDDLMILTFDSALDNQVISGWLKRSKGFQSNRDARAEEINIGLGCSSDTFRLSDEVVSLHSSALSIGWRNNIIRQAASNFGTVQINHFNRTGDFSFQSESVKYNPLEVLKVKNLKGWEIRMKDGLSEEIFIQLRKNTPNETGGLLIGKIDALKKTIYVTRVLEAPQDSIKTPYLFVRGVKGMPKVIRRIRNLTGGMIDFVGEWHTHPCGQAQLSGVDKNAVQKLRAQFDPIGYPTFVLIATSNKLHPYVFYKN